VKTPNVQEALAMARQSRIHVRTVDSTTWSQINHYVEAIARKYGIPVTVVWDIAAPDRDYSGTMYVEPQGAPSERWWEGLERVRARHANRAVYQRVHSGRQRGSYHYGNVTKACSYWRHTRTR
jgi:hypothetical protein